MTVILGNTFPLAGFRDPEKIFRPVTWHESDHYFDLPVASEVLNNRGASPVPTAEGKPPIECYTRLLRDHVAHMPDLNANEPTGVWLHPLLHRHYVQRVKYISTMMYNLKRPRSLHAPYSEAATVRSLANVFREEVRAAKSLQSRAGYARNDPSTHDVEMLERLVAQIEDKELEFRARYEAIVQERNLENAELSIKESRSAITRKEEFQLSHPGHRLIKPLQSRRLRTSSCLFPWRLRYSA